MDEMREYANLAGNSGVTHYGLMDDGSLLVIFTDGSIYVYPFVLNKRHIEDMLTLARLGRGLATYIARKKPLGARCARVEDEGRGR